MIQFILASELAKDFELLHLDISRKSGLEGAGSFSISNLVQVLRQVVRLVGIVIRYRPTLVHLPMTSGWSFWKESAFYLVAKAFGTKTILHLHGGGFMDFYQRSSPVTRTAIRLVFNRASGVIVLSEKWKRFLEQWVSRKQRIRVISNSVSTEFIQDLKKGFVDSNNAKVRILSVGHLTERKGVFETLEAIPEVLARHPNVVFTFAGPEASRGIRQRMEDFCRTRGFRSQVELLGEVSGDAKAAVFKSSSLFLLPSHAENLSVAILEAMCAGLPIITTPVGANTDLLQDGGNCLFVPVRDSRSIAKAVCFLLENERARLSMGTLNRHAFEGQYSPWKIIQQWRSFYSQMCAAESSDAQAELDREAIGNVRTGESCDTGA